MKLFSITTNNSLRCINYKRNYYKNNLIWYLIFIHFVTYHVKGMKNSTIIISSNYYQDKYDNKLNNNDNNKNNNKQNEINDKLTTLISIRLNNNNNSKNDDNFKMNSQFRNDNDDHYLRKEKRSINKKYNTEINEKKLTSIPESESMILDTMTSDRIYTSASTITNRITDDGNMNRPSSLSSTISLPSSYHSRNSIKMNDDSPEEYNFAISATNSSSTSSSNGESGSENVQQQQQLIDSKDNDTNNNQNITICYHEEDIQRMDCYISENETCFGDPEYCSYTYDEYITAIKQYMFPTTSEWILICSHVVVFIMGLVGNALVCIAVYTNYSMRTVTNVFIVNLAVADFFVILVCLPPSVVWDVTETWFMGEIMCKIFGYIQVVSVTVSVLTLTFISIDRWYAICFPLRYRTKISRAIASVAFIWIFAFLSNIPELLALTIKGPKLRFGIKLFTQCVTTWDKNTEKNVMLARFMLLYTLPLILMTLAYFKIVRVLWKSDTIPGHRESRNHYQYTCGYSRGSCMPAANTSTMGQLRARRKAAKMLVAVVVMFAICYFPVHMFMIMRYEAGIQDEVKAVLALLSHWLCYANSAVNPVIYNFMSGKFRREFRNALEKCRCSRIRVEDRTLTHSTPASRLNNISPSLRSNYQLTSVRDITRDNSRQTVQTTFMENCGNGNTIINNNHNQNYSSNNNNINNNHSHHNNTHNNSNNNYNHNAHKNSIKLNNTKIS